MSARDPDPDVPAEAPPSYQQATGSSSASSSRPAAAAAASPSHLQVPGNQTEKNGIPISARRSMEDETRPLPKGWVRTFDPTSEHQFFVDTTKDPPRSIWVHPYDDEVYLSTLSGEERERIEEESLGRGKPMSKQDIIAAHSDYESEDEPTSATSSKPPGELPPRPEGKGKGRDDRSFGRKFKDKVTGTTHEERELQRKKRAEEERKMYEYHQRVRQAMAVAARTGQPQRIGTDTDGKEIFVEPPNYGGGYGGYGGNGYGMNPYGRSAYGGGVYTTPNARYIRPPNPYNRPYGGGYGGGYGLPLAIGGGLLGGLLLGDALGGF